MRTYKLHLIRHGLTQGNIESRYVGGGTDESLCPVGRQSIEELCQKYSYPFAENIYTSPMLRAVETCEIIYPNRDYIAVDNLRECNFGEFENKTFEELSQNPRFAQWLQNQSGFTPEGAESNQDFAQRCANALNEILMHMMKNSIHEAAVVCHGGVIAILMGLFAYPKKEFHLWATDGGCGFTVATTPEMWTRDNIIEAKMILPIGYDSNESEEQ